ncbi:MAG: M28 family peptidase [Polyangiales bacterium]
MTERPSLALRWLTLIAAFSLVVIAAFVANQPIAPLGLDAPSTQFSEARARPIVTMLADSIGVRPTGSDGAERAAQYLASQLRAIPRVEVEIQRVSDQRFYENTPYPYPLLRYHVTNVVARLPGRTRDAILLDAHFDTLGDSDGAGDDALGVAAIIEALRALAAGPMLERSVIVLANGGEEYGLFGADGFVRNHPLARDVRAYVYIDGSPGGAATLLYAGPGNPELVEAYARVAPRPQASSVVLDLMESGALSHDGDFRPLRDGDKPGLSLAGIGDLWAAHTSRDRSDRLQPGTLQHLGQTALAVTRELANGRPLPTGNDTRRMTYFDVLGLFVVRYTSTTAALLAALVLVLSAGSIAFARRQSALSVGTLATAAAYCVLALAAAVLAAVCAGLVLAFVLRRPHGWYSAPWVTIPAFVAPALAAMLAVHRRLSSRLRARGVDPTLAVWLVALVGWSSLLALSAARGARSAYIPLAWTAGLALSLIVAVFKPRTRDALFALAVAGAIPGAMTLASFAPVLRTMCAEVAFLPLPTAADPMLAALVASFVAAASAGAMIAAHAVGAHGRASLAFALLALLGLGASAAREPFTHERPRRVFVVHGEEGGRSAVLLRAIDALPFDPVLRSVRDARPVQRQWPLFEVFMPAPTHEVAAPSPSFAPPSVEVLSSTANPGATRTVRLRLRTATTQLRLFVERDRLARWSLGRSLAVNEFAGNRPTAYFQGVGPEGEEVELEVRGASPVELEVIATSFLPDEAMLRVARQFPSWAVMTPMVARTIRVRI